MKHCNFLYGLWLGVMAVALGLNSCSEDSQEDAVQPDVFTLSESVVTVEASGETCKIVVQVSGGWTITGGCDWCEVDKSRGVNTDTLTIVVAENFFREERNCEWIVKAGNGTEKTIQVKQKEALKDYVYRLPVIFHVLYQDAENINQNIHKNYIESLLPVCNRLYRQGHNDLDLGVEFFMATHDPAGKLLEEPGIERVHWSKGNVSVYDFIRSSEPEDVELLWDPDKYVNIVIFPFRESSGLVAISTMPFTVSVSPLKGLRAGDIYFERPLNEVYCVAFNTQYAIRPGAGVTLAHELGHYLGLFHVFSEGNELETDYCADTPNYNRSAYMEEVRRIVASEGAESPRLFERKDDAGDVFISRNIMDYEYTYQDEFTPDQYKRIRHVLENSPLIPGIKKTRSKDTKSTVGYPSPLIAW